MGQIKIFHKTKFPTKQAINLKSALEKCGVKTILEMFDGHKHVDISVPAARLDIEVDGLKHLTDADQIVADLNRGYHSHHGGYDTIHIPNQMIDLHLEKIALALAQACKIRANKINIHLA
ncbi:MAG TPA: hypothetical protein VHQ41_03790 [Patescibacteria group bacterium]|jgi:very-short-patch-repair endonuclease|nr:hypothetical protein [Patescibacteria group bacterium]